MLGVHVDETLSWSSHIDILSKKISSAIGALKRVRSFVPFPTLQTMYTSLIQSKFDYCSAVWEGTSKGNIQKLQKLQNRAARIITFSPYDASSAPLLQTLGWDRLALRRSKQVAVEMFKIHNKQAPAYLLHKFSNIYKNYDTRGSSSKFKLPLPKTNYGKNRLSYKGAYIWNSLPENLHNCKSLQTFKQELDELPPCFFESWSNIV